jgi:hypothetical protein
MGKRFDHIDEKQQAFIAEQKVFFVGTAMAEGRVNVSPKGMDTLRVLNANQVAWVNLTGSGNETATHLEHSDRMTIMFCAFEGKPLILRLYGTAKAYHEWDKEYGEYIGLFPDMAGKRQIIVMDVDLVQSSCGFAVPLMDFKEERSVLSDWAQKKGREGIKDYWKAKNATSLDGLGTPTVRDDQ